MEPVTLPNTHSFGTFMEFDPPIPDILGDLMNIITFFLQIFYSGITNGFENWAKVGP